MWNLCIPTSLIQPEIRVCVRLAVEAPQTERNINLAACQVGFSIIHSRLKMSDWISFNLVFFLSVSSGGKISRNRTGWKNSETFIFHWPHIFHMSIWETETASIRNTWTLTEKNVCHVQFFVSGGACLSKMGRFLLVACHSHHNQTPPGAFTSFPSGDADWSGHILISWKRSFLRWICQI